MRGHSPRPRMSAVSSVASSIASASEKSGLSASVTHRGAILARVGATDQDAVFEVDPDGLVAAEAAWRAPHELVSLGFERLAHLGRDCRFELHRTTSPGRLPGRFRGTEMAEPRGIAGLLHVHAEVDEVAEHLDVPLCLHIAAHQAEAEPGLAVPCDKPGDDRVKRPLARLQAIGMSLIEGEEAPPVLEREAQLSGDMKRAKPVKIALDQAHAVEVLI